MSSQELVKGLAVIKKVLYLRLIFQDINRLRL